MPKDKPKAWGQPLNNSTVPDWLQKELDKNPKPVKQQIHFLNLKATSTDGYEQALQAITGKIITLTTTPQHLIVVTE